MEFGKIVLVDYALSVFFEILEINQKIFSTGSTVKYSYDLILKDKNDVFTGNFIQFQDRNQPTFYKLKDNDFVETMFYPTDNDNIFSKIRIELFEKFNKGKLHSFSQAPLMNHPELLIEFLITFVDQYYKKCDIEFKSTVFNYHSKINGLSLPFACVSDELEIFSLQILEQN